METKNFLFILEGNKTYEAGVKPHIAFARGLKNTGHAVNFILMNKSREVASAIRQYFPTQENIILTPSTLPQTFKPDFIFTDDYPSRLRLQRKIKKEVGGKSIVYSHIFGGITGFFPGETGIPSLKSTLRMDFRRAIELQMKYLGGADYIVSNSHYTELNNVLFFRTFSSSVIYPPSDTRVFKYKGRKNSRNVLIYEGNYLESSLKIKELVSELIGNGYSVRVMGSSSKAVLFREAENQVSLINDIDNYLLAKNYRDSTVTILMPIWESYGNAGIESLLCGTPVLVRSYQPWIELVNEYDSVGIINSKVSLNQQMKIMSSLDLTKMKNQAERIAYITSIKHSTDRLLRTID